MLSRRQYLAGFAASAALPRSLRAAAPQRIAALDWGLAATLLSLGRRPVGVPAIKHYDRNIGEPRMPPGVTDIGLLFTPNFELLAELAPDAILITPDLGPARLQLERIAPLVTLQISPPNAPPYPQAQRDTLRLADLVGAAAAGQALIARTEAAITALRDTGGPHRGRDLLVISFIDDRHVSVYGANSLFQDVIERAGLRNAWTGPTGRAGFQNIGIQELVHMPEALVLSVQYRVPRNLAESLFWNALPFVRDRRVRGIPAVLASGGLPSAIRFAGFAAAALRTPDVADG